MLVSDTAPRGDPGTDPVVGPSSGAADGPAGEPPAAPGVDAETSDDALVRAARNGDQDAFGLLVGRHGPAMYRYAHRLVGSEADAAEIVQEALISAWKDLERFRGESSLVTWLFRLTHRRAVDLQRRRKATPVDDDVLDAMMAASPEDPLRDAMDGELMEALRLALAGLPQQQRAVWLLREIEGLSYDEIAVALALPPGSVRGLLQRARTSLADRMERWR